MAVVSSEISVLSSTFEGIPELFRATVVVSWTTLTSPTEWLDSHSLRVGGAKSKRISIKWVRETVFSLTTVHAMLV